MRQGGPARGVQVSELLGRVRVVLDPGVGLHGVPVAPQLLEGAAEVVDESRGGLQRDGLLEELDHALVVFGLLRLDGLAHDRVECSGLHGTGQGHHQPQRGEGARQVRNSVERLELPQPHLLHQVLLVRASMPAPARAWQPGLRPPCTWACAP
ncbi:MAG: hypothetical protein CL940_01375 [Deltaproteobacteria bacterium]|nr:hypothetical protein [Deltaproteobacteria bacterium]